MKNKNVKKLKKIVFDKGKELILSVFFPRRCPLCDEVISYGRLICLSCEKKIPIIREPVCKKCGKPLENERQEFCSDCTRKKHNYIQGKAVFSYEKEMKLSMYRFKYANRREYADFYAEIAKNRYKDWITYRNIEAIVPVPLYAGKKRKRGYNQAEVFAERLGKKCGIPVEKSLIKRVRNTVPQKELNEQQRKDNLKGAFQLGSNIVKYNIILLVDDIYTTGVTVDAVADTLIKAGVSKVYILSICIGQGC